MKVTRAAVTITVRDTAPKTTAFAASTVRRRGTAISVVRIRPVLYSPVITRTPRTPRTNVDRMLPVMLIPAGDTTPSPMPAAQASRPMPTNPATATDNVTAVEHTDQNLIHSNLTTRPKVMPVAGRVVVLIGRLL